MTLRGIALVLVLVGCAEDKTATPPPQQNPPPPVTVASASPPPPKEPTPEEKKKADGPEEARRGSREVRARPASRARPVDTRDARRRGGARGQGLSQRRRCAQGRAREPTPPPGARRSRQVPPPARDASLLRLDPEDDGGRVRARARVGTPSSSRRCCRRAASSIEPTSDPNGPADQQSTLSGQRFKAFLDSSPEIYGNVKTIVVDSKAPQLGLDKVADMVLLIREIHGYYNQGTLSQWLAEAWKALKPGGVLGVVQHRAAHGLEARGHREERLRRRGVGHPTSRSCRLQARGEVGDQREPARHEGLPRRASGRCRRRSARGKRTTRSTQRSARAIG